MANSALLTCILDIAERMKTEDGRKRISANYFLQAVLTVLRDLSSGQQLVFLQRPADMRELEDVRSLLKQNGMDHSAALEEIASALKREEYNPSIDELIFSKFSFAAESKAKQEGKEGPDVCTYLRMIFAEPTAAIKSMLHREEEGNEPGSKPDETGGDPEPDARPEQPSAASKLQDILAAYSSAKKGTDASDGSAPPAEASGDAPEAAAEPRPKPEENTVTPPAGNKAPEKNGKDVSSGLNQLSDTVNATRNIRNKLLERVIGQDMAINTFVSGYFQAQLSVHSPDAGKKPQATFLFAGPPGVGKTYLAESAADALGLPYMRFDMSEYADGQALGEFSGSDKTYRGSKEGNVTGFVRKNPHCVLLFDEIEKANVSVIYLFLQILDAGRIRDNYTDEEVSFDKAIIIFTTNAGKNLYDDPEVTNLSSISRKKILKALSTDVNPATGIPLFPAAICSRFASGNITMFNHLDANNLYNIVKRELDHNAAYFESYTGVKVRIDPMVPTAVMLSEGGKADARTVKGRARAFFHEEIYELFRLADTKKRKGSVDALKEISLRVSLEDADEDVAAMFRNARKAKVLLFAEPDMAALCAAKLEAHEGIDCYTASDVGEAREILFNHDITVVLCDVTCRSKENRRFLNLEDVDSAGHDFLTYMLEDPSIPVYLLQQKQGDITQEEFLSFAKMGVRDILTVSGKKKHFADQVAVRCDMAYQQRNMLKLAQENKVVSFKTFQTLSGNRKTATVELFRFRKNLAPDLEDSRSVLDTASKPKVSFADVIGAEDAKGELAYFVEYLKDPVKFLRRGVRAPKGVLLYGPPGTGKTLLAKAMAGESNVTFLTAEGNQFLKKYVGEGPEEVHKLFKAARKYAPAILFVDEIDAIGMDRNRSSDHAEITSDVLNAFLTEMDGFRTDVSKPVFVLAATNANVDPARGRSLDPALMRRFDRNILVDLPNKEERKRYLVMKMGKNPSIQLSEDQIENIAVRSTGMSLAELESVIEMALRGAIRSASGAVNDAAFEDAFETFNSGEKKEWSPETLCRTARHEAGHALLSWLSGDKPAYLTVVARGDHGGYMQHGDSENKSLYTKRELLARIRTALAGRAAELVYYGAEDGVSTGASGDLQQATRIAERMICCYGMDAELGLAYADAGSADGAKIRERVNAILAEQMEEAERVISENQQAMDIMVDVLMEKNHLKQGEIDAIFRNAVKR